MHLYLYALKYMFPLDYTFPCAKSHICTVCAGFKTTMFSQWKNIKLPFIAPCMLSSKILCMREKRRDADANNTMHLLQHYYMFV